MVVRNSGSQSQTRNRTRFQFRFKPVAIDLFGVDQGGEVRCPAHGSQLHVLGAEVEPGQVEPRLAIGKARLQPGFVAHRGFAVGDRQRPTEHQTALDRRRAITLGDAGEQVDVFG